MNQPKSKPTYVGLWLDESLLRSNDLSSDEKFILGDLIQLEKSGRVIFKSDKGLSQQFGINLRTVSRCLHSLDKKKLISRSTYYSPGHGGRKRTITLNKKNIESLLTRLSTNCLEPSRQFGENPLDNMAKVNNSKEITISKEQTSTQHRLSSVTVNRQNNATEHYSMQDLKTSLLTDYQEHEIDLALELYDTAHTWSKSLANVDIGFTPNQSVIESLIGFQQLLNNNDEERHFSEFLKFRYDERKIAEQSKSVNLSWLLGEFLDDDVAEKIINAAIEYSASPF